MNLESAGDPLNGTAQFAAPGVAVALRQLRDDADWRQNAELVFELDQGLTVGYRGFYDCRI